MDAGAAAYKLTVVVRQTIAKAPVPIRQKTAAKAMHVKTVWWRLLSNVLYTSWHVSRAVAGRPQVYSVASMHVISPSSALLCALARGRKRSTAQKTSPITSWPCTRLIPMRTGRSKPFFDVAW